MDFVQTKTGTEISILRRLRATNNGWQTQVAWRECEPEINTWQTCRQTVSDNFANFFANFFEYVGNWTRIWSENVCCNFSMYNLDWHGPLYCFSPSRRNNPENWTTVRCVNVCRVKTWDCQRFGVCQNEFVNVSLSCSKVHLRKLFRYNEKRFSSNWKRPSTLNKLLRLILFSCTRKAKHGFIAPFKTKG